MLKFFTLAAVVAVCASESGDGESGEDAEVLDGDHAYSMDSSSATLAPVAAPTAPPVAAPTAANMADDDDLLVNATTISNTTTSPETGKGIEDEDSTETELGDGGSGEDGEELTPSVVASASTSASTSNASKPEICRKDKRCGYSFFCIYRKRNENDCSKCFPSRRECDAVAAQRNARNINSQTACGSGEYLHSATARSFAKCFKSSASYLKRLDKKKLKVDKKGQRSDCSSYVFEKPEQNAAEQYWDDTGVARTLSWGVCDLGPSWFKEDCGRSLFSSTPLPLQGVGYTSTIFYNSWKSLDNQTDLVTNASEVTLLTVDGQCRYGVTSVLASFGEDCHTASKQLKKRLKQDSNNPDFSHASDLLEPGGAITCRCVSREEMQAANIIARFPARHATFGAGIFLLVVCVAIFIGITCVMCDEYEDISEEDAVGFSVASLAIFGFIAISIAMMFVWGPAQMARQQTKFTDVSAGSYANEYWQGCGTTSVPMDLPEPLVAVDASRLQLALSGEGGQSIALTNISVVADVGSEPEQCKIANECSPTGISTDSPYCIFKSHDENDCSLCFYAKRECHTAAERSNAKSANSPTTCEDGSYLYPATERKFAECKKVSSAYTQKMDNKQARIATREQRSECSSYVFESREKNAAETLWSSSGISGDPEQLLSWNVCDRGPAWFSESCAYTFSFPSAGDASIIHYNSSLGVGVTNGDQAANSSATLITQDGQCRYGVTSVLASFGEDCQTASEGLEKRLKQASSALSVDDLEPNGAITCRCVSKEEMQAANLSRFPLHHKLYYAGIVLMTCITLIACCCVCCQCADWQSDGRGQGICCAFWTSAILIGLAGGLTLGYAQPSLRHRINIFTAATNHTNEYWGGCGTTARTMVLTSMNTDWTSTTVTTTTTPIDATYECTDNTNIVAAVASPPLGCAEGLLAADCVTARFPADSNVSTATAPSVAASDQSLFGFAIDIPTWFFIERQELAPRLLQEGLRLVTDVESCQDMCTANIECFSMTFSMNVDLGSDGDDGDQGSGDRNENADTSNCKLYGKADTLDATGITEPDQGTEHCVVVERRGAEEIRRKKDLRDREVVALKQLGYTAGGIVVVVLVHYLFNEKQRDFEVSEELWCNNKLNRVVVPILLVLLIFHLYVF